MTKDTTDEPKGKPLTHEQRRMRERINLEAQNVIHTLQEQFLNFFIECQDTEGEAVNNKIREIDAKWRLYCKRKNLIPAAYTVMDKYMEQSIKEYYENKEQKKVIVEENATDTGTK
jgi:isochorismate hydrolase